MIRSRENSDLHVARIDGCDSKFAGERRRIFPPIASPFGWRRHGSHANLLSKALFSCARIQSDGKCQQRLQCFGHNYSRHEDEADLAIRYSNVWQYFK